MLWPLAFALLLLVLLYSLHRRQQERRELEALQEQLASTQEAQQRAELLLLSEPQAQLLWRQEQLADFVDDAAAEDTERKPHNTPLPEPAETFLHPHMAEQLEVNEEKLASLPGWLEQEACADLHRHLEELFAKGVSFSISLRTAKGELVEADGRLAGRHVMLRFRPLHGERLQALAQAHDQRQLKEQAQRLTRMLSTAPVPVWITNAEGQLQWANKAWLKLMEASSLEAARAEEKALLGRGEKAAATMLPAEEPWEHYLASVVIGQQRRHFEIWERPLERGIIHWAQDVTTQKALEEELERLRAMQGQIFDQLSTALAIFDVEQRLTFFNAAYARLWGLSEEWLAQRPREEEILNKLHETGKLVLMEDFPQWRQRWLEIHRQQEARRERWQLAGGHMVQVIAQPQPGEGVIMMFEDITEQMRLEARYREVLQVQEETLDNLHEALAVFGTDGRLKLFNRTFAELWQMDETRLQLHPHMDEIIAESAAMVEEPAFWDEVKFAVTGMSEERKPLSGRISHVDGRTLDYLVMPLPDGNTLIAWHDMTDAVRAERALRERAAALEESDKVKSAFLDSISYDLRTPLTTINGYSEMLEAGYAGELSALQQQYLQNVRAASNELLEKIDTILDLAAIDAGKMQLDVAEFDVLAMLEELADSVAVRLEQRDMALEIELAEDVQTMRGDRARVMQALRHLLLNAIGFGHKGQVVQMGARRDEAGNVNFWVADNGPGMNTEMLQRAFERFFARPSPEGHRGPGLGLPLVKALIELHGGRVELHSQEGRGTTVVCILPQQVALKEQA